MKNEGFFLKQDECFGDKCLVYKSGEVSAPLGMEIGRAIAATVKESGGRQIGVVFGASRDACGVSLECIRKCITTGLASVSEDIQVTDHGAGYPSLAAFAAKRFGHDLCICLFGKADELYIYLYDKYGMYPDRAFERSLSAALFSGVASSATQWREPVKARDEDGGSRLKHLFKASQEELPGTPLKRLSLTPVTDNIPSTIACEILISCGARVSDGSELKFEISDMGDDLTIFEGDTAYDFWHIRGVIIADILQRRAAQYVSLPYRAPGALHNMVEESEVKLRKFSMSALDSREDSAREGASRQSWLFDAVSALITLCDIMQKSGESLQALSQALPCFAALEWEEDGAGDERASMLSKFGLPDEEGVVVDFERGRVRMIARRHGFAMSAEAATEEDAAELIKIAKRRMSKLGKK